MTEPTHRERLLQVIDETPEEVKKDFNEWIADLPEDGFQNMFEGHPIFGKLTTKTFRPLIDEVMGLFWGEIEGDLMAFCDYWKNQIPSDVELDAMTEGDIIGLEDAFEADTERIFTVFLDRFQAKMNGHDLSIKPAVIIIDDVPGQPVPVVIGPFGSLEKAEEWKNSELHGVNNTVIETVDPAEASLLIQEKGTGSLKGEIDMSRYSFQRRYSFQFASREDAEIVLETAIGVLEYHEYVTVADLRELMGFSTNHTHHRIGWSSLKDLKIEEIEGQIGWIINFPEPKKLY